jgi:hypothetical protein
MLTDEVVAIQGELSKFISYDRENEHTVMLRLFPAFMSIVQSIPGCPAILPRLDRMKRSTALSDGKMSIRHSQGR